MITDVGIDLDGVLYPFMDSFKRYCLKRLGVETLPEPTHWDFYKDWGLDFDTFNEFLHEASKYDAVFCVEQPYEGVKEAWELLRSMDLKIHIMTARPQFAWEDTAKWLKWNGLSADSLHFHPTKTFLKQLAVDKAAMIDDHIAYYEQAEKHGIVPVLMDRPWNQSKQNATRVSSMMSFVELIRGYNLATKTAQLNKTNKHPYKEFNPWADDKSKGQNYPAPQKGPLHRHEHVFSQKPQT